MEYKATNIILLTTIIIRVIDGIMILNRRVIELHVYTIKNAINASKLLL